jgi:hypothetical protein
MSLWQILQRKTDISFFTTFCSSCPEGRKKLKGEVDEGIKTVTPYFSGKEKKERWLVELKDNVCFSNIFIQLPFTILVRYFYQTMLHTNTVADECSDVRLACQTH